MKQGNSMELSGHAFLKNYDKHGPPDPPRPRTLIVLIFLDFQAQWRPKGPKCGKNEFLLNLFLILFATLKDSDAQEGRWCKGGIRYIET